MNLLCLLVACRAWAGPPRERLARVVTAITLLSLEMQGVTLAGAGSLRGLVALNALIAVVSVGLLMARRLAARAPGAHEVASLPALPGTRRLAIEPLAIAALLLAVVIAGVNLARPIAAADPYHLARMARIEQLGTLAYDRAAADTRVNVLGWLYEALLADLHQTPAIGGVLLRLHGLWGLAFLWVGIAAVRDWLALPAGWPGIAVLIVPVVLHQMVLIKNDLFGAIPAFVALAWVVARADRAPVAEVAAAAALGGLAVAIKAPSFPVALVIAGALVMRRDAPKALLAAVGGGLAGAVAGGLGFTLVENRAVYGAAIAPLRGLGNLHGSVADGLRGLMRTGVSLVDLGQLTPRWWPGRGGWGGTFGLPFIWACGVLTVASWRGARMARRALVVVLACLAAFGAAYPDADLAHRMAIAPGLLAVAAAVGAINAHALSPGASRTAHRGLAAALLLTSGQVARSVWLYLAR